MAEENGKSESQAFYRKAIHLLNESKVPYLVGGAAAVFHHTGIHRDTKDLDIFCRPLDFPKILKYFGDRGYQTEMTDARWLGKIFENGFYVDVIFDSPSNMARVDDRWFTHAPEAEFCGAPTRMMAAEELIFCKIYVQNRDRYDGADVNHLILTRGKNLDWKRLIAHIDRHWQLLLAQLFNFQFVYPADYHDSIPRWVFDELMDRARQQYDLPASQQKVCRGPLLDQVQYSIDVKDRNYQCVTCRTI